MYVYKNVKTSKIKEVVAKDCTPHGEHTHRLFMTRSGRSDQIQYLHLTCGHSFWPPITKSAMGLLHSPVSNRHSPVFSCHSR